MEKKNEKKVRSEFFQNLFKKTNKRKDIITITYESLI